MHIISTSMGNPDSGLSHLVKAMACMVVIRDAQRNEKFIDDRPPSLPDDWIAEMNQMAATIIDRHPNPKAPYVQSSTLPDTIPMDAARDMASGAITSQHVIYRPSMAETPTSCKVAPCAAHGLVSPDGDE